MTFENFINKAKDALRQFTSSDEPSVNSSSLINADEFKKYLIGEGYKEYTDSGKPSTVFAYVDAVNEVCGQQNCDIQTLGQNIDTIVKEYGKGGKREKEGSKGHDTVINALKAFQKFVKKCAPVNNLVSLETKLKKAPALVKFAKPLAEQLSKNNLLNVKAKVALAMDISYSMRSSYSNGTVQEIVNRILPMAIELNNDGSMDFWYYGTRCKKMPDVTLANYNSAVPSDWNSLMTSLGGETDMPLVIRDIISFFKSTKLPVYVLVISDGDVHGGSNIKQLIKDSSRSPIFWQFVGAGGSNYGALSQLDTMSGRYVDNANFFALDDIRKVSDKELYARLLNEFPKWLKAIKSKGMIK